MKKPKHLKSKCLMERILAVLLSVSLVLTIINLTAFAMPYDEDSIRIVGFGELENEVRQQTLKAGASESDIIFPDSLLVTVEKYKLLEKINNKELEEETDLLEDEEKTLKDKSSETKLSEEDVSSDESPDADNSVEKSAENDGADENADTEAASEDDADGDHEDEAAEEGDSSDEKAEPEELKQEEADQEKAESEEAGAEEAKSEEAESKEAESEKTKAEEAESKESEPEAENPEEAKPEEAGSKEAEPEETKQEEAKSKESEPEESKPEEDKQEESETKEAAPEETTSEAEPEEDNGTDGGNDSARAVFKISDLFKAMTIFAAEPEDEAEYETEYEDVVLYGITWELDKKNSSFDEFRSDEPGAEFVYNPVVPGNFCITGDYPVITVTIEETLEEEIQSAPFSQSCVVDGVYITVFADEGVFPVDARLIAGSASDNTRASAEEAVEDQRGSDRNVVASYVFDITIVDENWNEIQPDTSKGSVKVAFSLDEVSNDNLDVEIYHIVEDGGTSAQRLDASTEGDTVVAETEGFSAYTLQVTYDVKMYEFTTLPAKLSQILTEVVLNGTPVAAPIPSDASLITVTPDQNGDYDIDCTGTFSSIESLKVQLSDGQTYEILLTQGYMQAGSGSLIYENGFNQSAQELVDVVLGNGVVASNQTRGGTAYTFGNGGNDTGLPSGVILDTSGKIPNTVQDPDLAALCQSMGVNYGGHTSVLEFEMQATGTELVFNYAFASNEFDQGPTFNDVFGLFISVNGGPYQNIALITRSDGTMVPVTIVNLRAGLDGTEMSSGTSTALGPSVVHTLFTEKNLRLIDVINGISNVFTAKANVNIGDVIKLKFAICDVGDSSHNSYVFIEAGSVNFNIPDGRNDYFGEEINNLHPNSLFEVTSGGFTHPITSSSTGTIPMEGTDDNGDTYSFLGETISIVEKGDATHPDSQPQMLAVADRPVVLDIDTSQGSREVTTTDSTIELTLDSTDPDKMRQLYRLFDGYGNPINGFGWVKAGDVGGNLSFSGLDPDTEYLVKIYIPATNQYPKSFTTPGVRIKTDPEPAPLPVKRTEVVVHGNGSPISRASVKCLDEYTDEQTGQKVIVRLNIIPEDESSVDPAFVSYVDTDLKARYANSSDDHIFAEYMDINVTRQIDDGPIEYIPDVGRVIEIAVRYDLTDKLEPVVFREHEGNITVLDALQQRPSGNYQEGEVYISGNTIYIYAQKFSTYAVGYYTYEEPEPDPPVKKTEVEHGEGGPISSATVNGLDDYTNEQAGQKVIVRLNVTPEDESSVNPATVAYVDADLKARYANSSDDHIFAEYMDMNVTRQIDNGPTELIPDVERVVEIAVGYDLTDKLDPVVFREHEGNITVLDALQQRPSGNYQEGTVYIDGNTIYFYAQYFSTYVVGYHTYEEPEPVPEPVPDPPKPTPEPDPPQPEPEPEIIPDPVPEPVPDPPKPEPEPEPDPPAQAETYEQPEEPVVVEPAPVLEQPTPEPPVIKVVGRAPKTDNRYVEKKVWILLLILELLLIGAVVATNILFSRILKKENLQRKWIIALCRVGALLIFVTVAIVTQINFDYIKSQAMYQDIKYEYVSNPSVSEKAHRIADQYASEQREYWNKKDIDVAKMMEEYPDIVGWILFENEDISYPLMYSGDNYTYLQSAYNGGWAYAGAIFVDGLSSPDFSDRNTLIYGHNMRDKSMFGKLKYYEQDPEYFETHQYFQIHTAEKVYRYRIFAVEEVGDDDAVYYTYGKDPEMYTETLSNIIQNSRVENWIAPDNLEHIVTLSTCTAADDKRLIICAARVGEEDK